MKNWDPRIISGRGRRRARLPVAWHAYRPRRRWRFSVGATGLMALGGVMLGFVMALASPFAQGGMTPQSLVGSPASTRVQPAAIRVIDGDTFDYRGVRVRVADIDTPEVDGRCPRETALAARATRRMRALLAQGPFELHRLPNGRDEDRYGRKLRIVTRGGRSLGDQLVAEGLARTWTGRRQPWCA